MNTLLDLLSDMSKQLISHMLIAITYLRTGGICLDLNTHRALRISQRRLIVADGNLQVPNSSLCSNDQSDDVR